MPSEPIATIVDCLESEEAISISAEYIDDWPPGVITALIKEGVLGEPGTVTSVICRSCENEHSAAVHYVQGDDGFPQWAYYECPYNPHIGQVRIPWDDLRCWPIRLDGLLRVLAREMAVASKPREEGTDGRLWYLGKPVIGERRVPVFLLRGVTWSDALARFSRLPNGCAALMLGPDSNGNLPSTAASVSLATLLQIEAGRVHLDVAEFAATVNSHRIDYCDSVFIAGVFRHSMDFRSVRLRDVEYALPPDAARVVEALWREAVNGTPDLSTAYIFEYILEVPSEDPRIKDTFKRISGWNNLIVVGKTRGTIRLNL